MYVTGLVNRMLCMTWYPSATPIMTGHCSDLTAVVVYLFSIIYEYTLVCLRGMWLWLFQFEC